MLHRAAGGGNMQQGSNHRRSSAAQLTRRGAGLALLAGVAAALVALGCRAEAPQLSLREEFRRAVVAGRGEMALAPRSLGTMPVGRVAIERVRFTPEPGQDAVAVLYRPREAPGKLPVVVVQHFLGATKDHPALIVLLHRLADQGFLAAAIDGRYRGERQNGTSLNAAVLQSLRTGHGQPLFLDTVYDVMRLLDYLQTRPDVDGTRIGMTGFSEGGVITWMTAVADDRVRAAAPIVGVTAFGDALRDLQPAEISARTRLFEPVLKDFAKDLGEPDVTGRVIREAWQRLVPGLLDRFDAPNLVPLIAPRPLLILQHEQDELFPLTGARKVEKAARERYQQEGAPDRFAFRVAPGLTHSAFNLNEISEMEAWMARWLKP